MPTPEATTSPIELINLVRDSTEYKEALEKFFENKLISLDVTVGERRASFESSPQFARVIVAFSQEHTSLKFDPNQYSPSAQMAIEEYIIIVTQIQSPRRIHARDEILALDEERSRRHTILANALESEGIVPNHRVGRVIGRLILINQGIDTYQSALESVK